MKGVFILFGIGIVFLLLAVYMWKKGNAKETFWAAFADIVSDLFLWHLPLFSSFRTWSLFIGLIGSVIVFLGMFGMIKIALG